MNIIVQQIDDSSKLILKFMPYFRGEQRLWIRDPSQWFQTVGPWCPHININGFECSDCSLNVE